MANSSDFGVVENHLCASHNTTVKFYRIANRVKFASGTQANNTVV